MHHSTPATHRKRSRGSLAARATLVFCLLPRLAAAQEAAEPTANDRDASGRAAEAVARTASLETLAGTANVPLAELGYSEAARALAIGGETIPLADVLSLRFASSGEAPAPAGPATALLLLRSGEELYGEPGSGTEDEILLRASTGAPAEAPTAPFRVALEKVRAVVFPRHFPSTSDLVQFRRSLPGGRRQPIAVEAPAAVDPEEAGAFAALRPEAPAADRDRLIIAENTGLSGLLGAVSATEVAFDADDVGAVKLPFDKVRAVTVADLGAGAGGGAEESVLEVLTHCADGSLYRGTLVSIGDGAVRMRSIALREVSLRLDSIVLLEVQGGRCRYLSDLDPARATSKDPFSTRAVQRDANVLGGAMILRERRYRKGLGMRSHTRLEYSLDEEYERFQAVAGIDDVATLASVQSRVFGGGTAVFRVLVDDELRFERELSYRSAPEAIDVSLDGGTVLTLEVDYGPGLWMQDYADWADAKLIRG
jgi:hypothetical protein